jgi:DNA-binding transcriptional LysR family regulator
MKDHREPESGPAEFDTQEGLALALGYLEDPSDVPCPRCGPDTMEVVCYLDAPAMAEGTVAPTAPEGDYTVVLYCHRCGRAAALDLSRDEEEGREAA